jgi:thymidylate synthase
MHFVYRNVNEALPDLVIMLNDKELDIVSTSPSRVGNVLMFTEPVTVTYQEPTEKVLFNEARDANPFFHLYEAMWMLAGRNDLAGPTYFAKNYAEQVKDEGKNTANGAYGYRWRRWLVPNEFDEWREVDQLSIIAERLKKNPFDRRCVLEMWSVHSDLLRADTSKDVCCNTHAYFSIRNGRLDMTVCNRSNDLIWGMLGANVVHFAFLQEYMAKRANVDIGVYNQFTNNLHVYQDRFNPQELLDDRTEDIYQTKILNVIPLVHDIDTFDAEVKDFAQNPEGHFSEPFLRYVGMPMCLAFRHHRERDYVRAFEAINAVMADDWRFAGTNWLRKRATLWESKKDHVEANPYLVNELRRQASGSDQA